MKVEIKKATKKDVSEIVRLNGLLFKNEIENKYDTTIDPGWVKRDGKRYFSSAATGKNSVIFVAENEGKIIGYICGNLEKAASFRKPVKMAKLDNMLVEEAFRKHNVGSKLIAAFENWCREKKVNRIAVTASAPNVNAIRFYRKNGFSDYESILEKDV